MDGRQIGHAAAAEFSVQDTVGAVIEGVMIPDAGISPGPCSSWFLPGAEEYSRALGPEADAGSIWISGQRASASFFKRASVESSKLAG